MSASERSTLGDFNEILDRITDGVFSLDREWNYTFVNRAGAQLVGYEVEELIGRNLWDAFPDAVGTEFERVYRDALETQEPRLIEAYFEPLGKTYAVRVFPSEEGLTIYYQDVTDRETARRELAERARQQAALALMGQRCLAEVSVERALSEVAEIIAGTLDAERVEVLGRPDAGGSLTVLADHCSPQADGLASPVRIRVPGSGDRVVELLIYGGRAATPNADVRDFINAAVALISSSTRQINVLQEVEHMALHEPLTGLPNRRLLLQQLERMLDTAEPDAPPPAVLTVAVDRLWVIVNSYGHRAGDQLMLALSDRIRRVCEPEGMLAQLANDLFVVVIHQPADEQAANSMAERLHGATRESIRTDSGDHFVTISIGITHASELSSPLALLRDADTALRRAKPPLRTAVFGQRDHDEAVRRAEVDRQLHQALDRNELVLHYQPIVSSDESREPLAMEALIRWNHPERGLIQPGEFIEVAEENGLILPIGDWVLWQACTHATQMQNMLDGPFSVSVNVSARQLADPEFVERVASVVRRTGLEPGTLGLEITESALLEEGDFAATLLNDIRNHGIKVALDDFGAGYSSLNYLRQLPVDTLKIDRSFVRDLGNDPGASILEAIIKMAHAMKMTVVAEGIETQEQEALLRSLDCNFLQGYLYSPPVPFEQVLDLVSVRAA